MFHADSFTQSEPERESEFEKNVALKKARENARVTLWRAKRDYIKRAQAILSSTNAALGSGNTISNGYDATTKKENALDTLCAEYNASCEAPLSLLNTSASHTISYSESGLPEVVLPSDIIPEAFYPTHVIGFLAVTTILPTLLDIPLNTTPCFFVDYDKLKEKENCTLAEWINLTAFITYLNRRYFCSVDGRGIELFSEDAIDLHNKHSHHYLTLIVQLALPISVLDNNLCIKKGTLLSAENILAVQPVSYSNYTNTCRWGQSYKERVRETFDIPAVRKETVFFNPNALFAQERRTIHLRKVVAEYNQKLSTTDDFMLYCCRANTHHQLGHFDQAVTDYLTAAQMNPDYADRIHVKLTTLYYEYGCAKLANQQPLAALEYFNIVLQKYQADHQQTLAQINNIFGNTTFLNDQTKATLLLAIKQFPLAIQLSLLRNCLAENTVLGKRMHAFEISSFMDDTLKEIEKYLLTATLIENNNQTKSEPRSAIPPLRTGFFSPKTKSDSPKREELRQRDSVFSNIWKGWYIHDANNILSNQAFALEEKKEQLKALYDKHKDLMLRETYLSGLIEHQNQTDMTAATVEEKQLRETALPPYTRQIFALDRMIVFIPISFLKVTRDFYAIKLDLLLTHINIYINAEADERRAVGITYEEALELHENKGDDYFSLIVQISVPVQDLLLFEKQNGLCVRRRHVAIQPDAKLTKQDIFCLQEIAKKHPANSQVMQNENSFFHFDDKHAAIFHNNLGVYFYHLGSLEKAIREYSHALELDPFFWLSIYNRANAYLSLGRFEDAIQDYKQLLAMKENDPSSALLAEYKTIVLPKLISAYYELGCIHLFNKNYKEALRCFNTILEEHNAEHRATKEQIDKLFKNTDFLNSNTKASLYELIKTLPSSIHIPLLQKSRDENHPLGTRIQRTCWDPRSDDFRSAIPEMIEIDLKKHSPKRQLSLANHPSPILTPLPRPEKEKDTFSKINPDQRSENAILGDQKTIYGNL